MPLTFSELSPLLYARVVEYLHFGEVVSSRDILLVEAPANCVYVGSIRAFRPYTLNRPSEGQRPSKPVKKISISPVLC